MAPPYAESAFGDPLGVCLRRIRSWRAPPNWRPFHWREEIEAHAAAAACAAESAYDPASRIPFGAFVYQRVMARALTRYRQEWAYACRCISDSENDNGECLQCAAACRRDHCDLDAALASLSEAQRWLLEQLYWRDRTEAAVAARLGLSQRAVSKRKQVALRILREWLDDR
jgi:DNA-directed RNA polymerase specialized sigma24 family protein